MTIRPAKSDETPASHLVPMLSSDSVAATTSNIYFGREDIGGRFSLIDEDPMYIRMEAGAVLYIHAGSVSSAQSTDETEILFTKGRQIVAEGDRFVSVRSRSGAELQIDWPVAADGAPTASSYKN